MRKRYPAALGLTVAAMLMLPGFAVAQEDSVVGSGEGGASVGVVFDFSLSSGPSGENPSGSASFVVRILGDAAFTATEVNCLSVIDDTATFVIRLAPNSFDWPYFKVIGVDDPSAGDIFGVAAYATPPTCSPDLGGDFLANAGIGPLTTGNITVTDAQPLPTSKDQCKNGGWRNYGTTFKNQGQCVSFVATGGKKQP